MVTNNSINADLLASAGVALSNKKLAIKTSLYYGACLPLFCDRSSRRWKIAADSEEIKTRDGCNVMRKRDDVATIEACINIEDCFGVPENIKELHSNCTSILARYPSSDPMPSSSTGIFFDHPPDSPSENFGTSPIDLTGDQILGISIGMAIVVMAVVLGVLMIIYRNKSKLEAMPDLPEPYAELCGESKPRNELPGGSNIFPLEMNAVRELAEMDNGRKTPCVELEGQSSR